MGEIIELDEITTLKGLIFLKEYTRLETLLPGRFVHVRRHGLYAMINELKYVFDLGVGVSDTPKIRSSFYNIPIVGSDSNVTFDGPYIVRSVIGINERDLPDVRNCNKLIMYEYSNSLCCSMTGLDAKNRRRQLRTKIDDILLALKN